MRLPLVYIAILIACLSAPAPAGGWRGIPLAESAAIAREPRGVLALATLARQASVDTAAQIGGTVTSPDEVWMTVIDARDPFDPRIGSHKGEEPVYPASVVKLCYMVAAFDHNRTRGLAMDEALKADLRTMVGPSSNVATNAVLERLTNTNYGPALDSEAYASFAHKRETVARYMADLGLAGLWPINKTYDGRTPFTERCGQFLGDREGDNYENSNKMTTEDTARLLYLIWRRAVVDGEACEEMLALMKRDEESRTYFSKITPEDATLYSKDGSTGLDRHDAAIFAFDDGGAIIIVAFSKTRGEGERPQVIEGAAAQVLHELRAGPGVLDVPSGLNTPGERHTTDD